MMEQVAANWAEYLKFRDGFAQLLDERFYPLGWLDQQVFSGALKLWTNEDAAIIAELKAYPGGAVEVHGMAATGDLDAIRRLIPLAEQWGASNGAILATIASRPGWASALKDYQMHQVVIRKELR